MPTSEYPKIKINKHIFDSGEINQYTSVIYHTWSNSVAFSSKTNNSEEK